MIRLAVLGSGSKGNAFALETRHGIVLVDAGFSPRTLFRRAELAGLSLERLAAIILTHEHGDHAGGAAALGRQAGVPILCSPGTWAGLGPPEGVAHVPLYPARPLSHGGFSVDSILTTHDAREPLAVAVTADGVRVAFAMDIGRTTTSVRYVLQGAHAIVLESNYDDLLLRTGRYPPSVQQRIAGSSGHLSNRAAASLAASVLHDGLSVVVLAHLSQQCNHPDRARATVEPVLRAQGYAGQLHVAAQDSPLAPIPIRAPMPPAQTELGLGWEAGVG